MITQSNEHDTLAQPVNLPCLNCGAAITKPVRWYREHQGDPCDECGSPIYIMREGDIALEATNDPASSDDVDRRQTTLEKTSPTYFQLELLKGAATFGGVSADDSNKRDLDALVTGGYMWREDPTTASPGATPQTTYRPTEKGLDLLKEPEA